MPMLGQQISQYHLKYLLEVTPLAMALFDCEMRYIAYNQLWLKEYDMLGAELHGKTHYEIFPEIGPEWKAVHQRGLRGEVVSSDMDCMVRQDGSTHWLRWEVRPWFTETGEIGGLIIFSEDKTLQKIAEDALRKREASYKLLFEAHPAPLWVYDMQTLDFIEVNDAAIHRYGYSRKEFLTLNLKDIRPAEDYDRLLENVKTHNESYSFSGEWRHIDKSGKVFDVEIISHAIEYNQRSARLVMAMDITEKKKYRNKLQQLNSELEQKVIERTSQLEATVHDLEAFSYSVSHDLRAPLRHINGFVKLLTDKFSANLPEKAVHYLETITNAATQMGALIDDLLQFSRTGRQEIQFQEVDMNEMVASVVTSLKHVTELRKLEWKIQELPCLQGDKAMLRQAFYNLLDNAVKYTRKTPQAIIEVNCRRVEGAFEFEVRDNGIGFDMKYSQKLFGVFQRMHSSADFEGTGIGLANVKQIVQKHGGTVRAEAEPGSGAIFYIQIPLK